MIPTHTVQGVAGNRNLTFVGANTFPEVTYLTCRLPLVTLTRLVIDFISRRPDAVMSTVTTQEKLIPNRISRLEYQGHGTVNIDDALWIALPLLLLSKFQGMPILSKKRELCHDLTTSAGWYITLPCLICPPECGWGILTPLPFWLVEGKLRKFYPTNPLTTFFNRISGCH